MALPRSLARATVTVLHPVWTDDQGTLTPDWSQPPESTDTVTGCSVQPAGGGSDLEDHRNASSVSFTAYMPPGAPIGTHDHVTVPGYPGELVVMGEPQRWLTGLSLDHVAVNLTVWEG